MGAMGARGGTDRGDAVVCGGDAVRCRGDEREVIFHSRSNRDPSSITPMAVLLSVSSSDSWRGSLDRRDSVMMLMEVGKGATLDNNRADSDKNMIL